MKYTKEERLDIGRRIYEREITKYQAAEIYDINESTARSYMRLYRDVNHLPDLKRGRLSEKSVPSYKIQTETADLEAYEEMSKEELIRELVKARITEARLKKGYEVKGDGSVIRYDSKNTK